MASPTATAVRPPRPKKEPQTLVIPKNAAEEQKLKLERLMKNPVSRSGLCGRPRSIPLAPPGSGTLPSVPLEEAWHGEGCPDESELRGCPCPTAQLHEGQASALHTLLFLRFSF